MSIFDEIVAARNVGVPVVLATVVESLGSAPREAGAKMLIKADGSISGTVGGGAIEKRVMEEALQLLPKGGAKLLHYDLGKDLGMSCGGQMTVFLEPLVPALRLIIFGAGHVGTALSQIGKLLGFTVWVIDNRREYATPERLPFADKVIAKEYAEVFAELPFDENTYAVLVTHKHAHDQEILEHCVRQKFCYLGMIGSRNKVAKAFARLREIGIDEGTIGHVHAPIGMEIGANTPAEIAVAIAAELVAVKAGMAVKRAKATESAKEPM